MRPGQMYLHELLLNPSVKAEDEVRLGKQAAMIFRILTERKLSTGELSVLAPQYNARIWEIRRYLEQFGQTVKMTPGDNGNNLYEIVDI